MYKNITKKCLFSWNITGKSIVYSIGISILGLLQKILQVHDFKQWKCIFSQFCWQEVWNQGVSRIMLPLDTLSKNSFFFSLTCDNHWKILGMTWFKVASLQPLSPLSHGPLNCMFNCSVSFSLQRHWSLDLGPTSTQYNPVPVLSSKSYQSNHLILCHPLLLLPSIYPSTKVFSNESVPCIRQQKYWSFSFSSSPSNEYLGLIFFQIHWLDLAAQGTLRSLLQHHFMANRWGTSRNSDRFYFLKLKKSLWTVTAATKLKDAFSLGKKKKLWKAMMKLKIS